MCIFLRLPVFLNHLTFLSAKKTLTLQKFRIDKKTYVEKYEKYEICVRSERQESHFFFFIECVGF